MEIKRETLPNAGNFRQKLTSNVIREHFGALCGVVAEELMAHGSLTLAELVSHCKKDCEELNSEGVRRILASLIQHGVVEYVHDEKRENILRYSVKPNAAISRLRLPAMIVSAQKYGPVAVNVLETLVEYGVASGEKILECARANGIDEDEVFSAMKKLSLAHLIIRAIQPKKEEFVVPDSAPIEVEKPKKGRKRATSTKKARESEEPLAKKAKVDSFDMPQGFYDLQKQEEERRQKEAAAAAPKADANDFFGTIEGLRRPKVVEEPEDDISMELISDPSILWKCNLEAYERLSLRKYMLQFVANKFGTNAAEIVDIMLKMTAADTNKGVDVERLMEKLQQSSRAELRRMPMEHVVRLLDLVASDKSNIVTKRIEQHDATQRLFSVQRDMLIGAAREKIVASVLKDKFGIGGLRVFRLLLEKKMLEQKQISDQAMLGQKEAKAVLYKMMQQGYCSFLELPKNANIAMREALQSIFLWKVNLDEAFRLVREEIYHAILNLRLRDAQEVESIACLVEKAEVDRDREDGVPELLTPAEKETFNQFLQRQDRLESTILSLVEMAFVMSDDQF